MDYTLADLTKAVSMFKNVEKKEEYIISFTKEDDGLWYGDYPNWTFDHSHLQMVRGADKLCELLSYDGKHTKVSVIPSKEHKILQSHDINERFALIRNDSVFTESDITKGAIYQVQVNQFKSLGGGIWLSPVILFVIGEYPKYIYLKSMMKPLISQFYDINGREEAYAFMQDPILSKRLIEATEAVLNNDNSVYNIFGHNIIKFHSCMLLFATISDNPVFKQAIKKYHL